MYFEEFKKQIEENKTTKQIYFFLGKERYVKKQAYSSLVERYTRPATRDLNIETLSGPVTGFDQIISAAETFPMMSDFRLVFVKEAGQIKDTDVNALKSYMQNPAPHSIVVFDAEEMDPKTTLYKLLIKHCALVEFNSPKGQVLIRWVHSYLRSTGYNAEYSTLQKLVDYTGSDLSVVVNELEKLTAFAANSSSKVITQEMVVNLAVKSRSYSVFELIDALGRKQRRKALLVLNDLLRGGEEPLRIIAMLARQFRQMLIAKTLLKRKARTPEIIQQTQVPNFLIDDFLRQLKGFKEQDIIRNIKEIARADIMFKTTSVNQKFYLEKMLCQVTCT